MKLRQDLWMAFWLTAVGATAAATCWKTVEMSACQKAALPPVGEAPCDVYEWNANVSCPSTLPAAPGLKGNPNLSAPWTATCAGWVLTPSGETCIRGEYFSFTVNCRNATGPVCVAPPGD